MVVIVLQKITKDNREGNEGRVALLRKLGQGLINYFFNFRFAACDSKESYIYIYIYMPGLAQVRPLIVSEKTINVRSDFLAEKKFWKTSKNVFQ